MEINIMNPFIYIENFIPKVLSVDFRNTLISSIENGLWDLTLSRRTQHYGWRYDYKARSVSPNDYLGPLPLAFSPLVNWISDTYGITMDQAIVNEYTPGQGIGDHVDCEPCFGDAIVSLSLLSGVPMTFKSLAKTSETYTQYLSKDSLVIISGDVRHLWTHGIERRTWDMVDGLRVERQRRISVTLRTIRGKNG